MILVSAIVAGLAFAIYANLAASLIKARFGARIAIAGWGLGFPVVFVTLAYLTWMVGAGLDGGDLGSFLFGILLYFPAIIFGSAATAVVLRFAFGDRVAWASAGLAACAALLTTSYPLLVESFAGEPPADDTHPVVNAMMVAWNATLCGSLVIVGLRMRRVSTPPSSSPDPKRNASSRQFS